MYSERTLKILFSLADNTCAYPGCEAQIVVGGDTVVGHVCHIRARSKGGPRYDPSLTKKECDSHENLILLCRDHHGLVDANPEKYPVEDLLQMKEIHEKYRSRKMCDEDAAHARLMIELMGQISVESRDGNVMIASLGGVQVGSVGTLNVKSSQERISTGPAPGTIGANQVLSRYIAHLIKRYNEFAYKEVARDRKFSFGALSNNIETRFGNKWRDLGEDKAIEVIQYLQGRIDRTRIARLNKGKGKKSYSSLDEFLEKYGR